MAYILLGDISGHYPLQKYDKYCRENHRKYVWYYAVVDPPVIPTTPTREYTNSVSRVF